MGNRVRYPEPLAHYAALYGSDERSLKRYVERGRYDDVEKHTPRVPIDLPPFHLPAEMPEWWSRRMSTRCPASILEAAAKANRAVPLAPPLQSQPDPPPAQPPAPVATSDAPTSLPPETQRDFSEIRTLDIAGNVEQLRRSLAILEHQLEQARRGQVIEGKLVVDDGLISSRQRDYRETFSELRKAENDLLEYQKKSGDMAPREEVRAENNRIAAAIFRSVCALLKTVRPQLAGKSESEQDRIWKDETLGCFASLKTANFTTFEVPREVA